jgi:hypothetical protein
VCGDTVLIADKNMPRNEWLMGRVMDTYQGADGKVRSVKIKTKRSELVRPVNKVCLLESVEKSVEISGGRNKDTMPPSLTSEE